MTEDHRELFSRFCAAHPHLDERLAAMATLSFPEEDALALEVALAFADWYTPHGRDQEALKQEARAVGRALARYVRGRKARGR